MPLTEKGGPFIFGGPGTGGIVYAIPLIPRIGKAVSMLCRSTPVRSELQIEEKTATTGRSKSKTMSTTLLF